MSSLFTPQASSELDGPAWLRARRAAAADALVTATPPSAEEEVWRYSRISRLDLAAFHPASAAATQWVPVAAVESAAEAAAHAVLVDGRVVSCTTGPQATAAGVYVGPLADAPNAAGLLGSAMAEPVDYFAVMNDAFSAEPLAVVVPRGVRLEAPVVIEHHSYAGAAATFPRLVVWADDDAEVRVAEHFVGSAVSPLVVSVAELVASGAATIGYLSVQELSATAWHVGSVITRGQRDSAVRASVAAIGGEYARVRTDAHLVGRGADATVTALYYGTADQMHDLRSHVDHAAPDTSCHLLFTGVVDDRAASVYTGRIHVHPGARGANALQTNRNIKLSEGAWAESVPNLEIENNDVRCKHESSVSPIDADQRFYLESRGIPPQVADRLIVAGFFDEVLSSLSVRETQPALVRAITAKLDRLDRTQ